MNDFVFESDTKTGKIASVKLYGEELLDPQSPCSSELLVNGLPLKTRPYPIPGKEWNPQERVVRLKGERFVDHFSGWGLVVSRTMGARTYMKHPCFGIHYLVRREQADMTEQTDGTVIGSRADGKFPAVPAGIYKMAMEAKTA